MADAFGVQELDGIADALRVYASALMPITVRGRVAVATRTRSRRSVR